MTARRGRNGVLRPSALPSDGRVAQRARHFERSQIQAKTSTQIDASLRLVALSGRFSSAVAAATNSAGRGGISESTEALGAS
jgi:hypothetical protein